MSDYPEQYVVNSDERNRKWYLNICKICDIAFHTRGKQKVSTCSRKCQGTKYRNYTDEDVINKAKEVISLRQLLITLDLRAIGGNYANMKRILQRLEVDTSHWKGTGWSKDQRLKDWSNYTKSSTLKPHLIKERTHKCENCNLSNWCGELITLELHHIDGDRTNNKLENLCLLCPNCHAMTDNWRNKKK